MACLQYPYRSRPSLFEQTPINALSMGFDTLSMGFDALSMGFDTLSIGFDTLSMGSDVLRMGFGGPAEIIISQL